MRLSVLIPAHNEEGAIADTVERVVERLDADDIDHEVLVVDDGSSDATPDVLSRLAEQHPTVRSIRSPNPPGFGYAVRAGLEVFDGDAVVIMMADGSDHPDDVVVYYRLLEAGYDCAFGSRFMRGSRVKDYPRLKLLLNRVVNTGIRMMFGHGYNDTTNAFKAYRREVIESVQPLLSPHFNLTVEIPLKAIVRGHSYAITPIAWRNRTSGTSKLQLQEMGSRYVFIVLHVFFEHHLARGDYRRPGQADSRRHWPAASPGIRRRD